MTPKRPIPLKRKPKPVPRWRVKNVGIGEFCRVNNISEPSTRAFVRRGLSYEEAARLCRERDLVYFPRGVVRPGWERKNKKIKL